ncbi:MAG: hypothetical protein ACE5J4_01670 [Candidatus Aenigmatarchaeota archaeon]
MEEAIEESMESLIRERKIIDRIAERLKKCSSYNENDPILVIRNSGDLKWNQIGLYKEFKKLANITKALIFNISHPARIEKIDDKYVFLPRPGGRLGARTFERDTEGVLHVELDDMLYVGKKIVETSLKSEFNLGLDDYESSVINAPIEMDEALAWTYKGNSAMLEAIK